MLHRAARGQREDLLRLLVERCCPGEHQLAAVDEVPSRPSQSGPQRSKQAVVVAVVKAAGSGQSGRQWSKRGAVVKAAGSGQSGRQRSKRPAVVKAGGSGQSEGRWSKRGVVVAVADPSAG